MVVMTVSNDKWFMWSVREVRRGSEPLSLPPDPIIGVLATPLNSDL